MSQRKKSKESVQETEVQNSSRRVRSLKCNENQRRAEFHRDWEQLEVWERGGKGE